MRAALAAVKKVDAGAIAKRVPHRGPGEADDDAVAQAIRAARRGALRELLWKKRSPR